MIYRDFLSTSLNDGLKINEIFLYFILIFIHLLGQSELRIFDLNFTLD